MNIGNVGKSLIGLSCYFPLCLVNVIAERIAYATEVALDWIETDERFFPKDGVDGDTAKEAEFPPGMVQ